jgi:short-subunit dehydrogenase
MVKYMHTALITGASAGLGAEFARQLAAKGVNIVLVARRLDRLQRLADVIRDDYGVDVDVMTADLSQPEAPGRLFAECQHRGLQVDYLVNNAGAAGPDLLANRDWTSQREYTELMMTSVAAMCHFFIPPMRERGFGRVINVASVAGRIPLAGDSSYGPAKAYLIALSEALNATLRDEGIKVLALCPGFTHTEFHESEKLSKMKKASPDFIWYDADVVIREGLEALEKGKPLYLSGRLYRWLDPLLQFRLTRRLISRKNHSQIVED